MLFKTKCLLGAIFILHTVFSSGLCDFLLKHILDGGHLIYKTPNFLMSKSYKIIVAHWFF